MIKITNLTKRYGTNIGNFDINVEVKDNEIYGILGPNGAGKTTLIRQILGFIYSDKGEISINGLNPQKDAQKIMEFTGYVAGEISLFENLTGEKYIKLMAGLRSVDDWDFIDKLIQHFEIDTSRKIKKMSKGMKQKIAIIVATMNKPKFLVLDEPTSGLDPMMKEQFNELILKLREVSNTTVIICSHIFEEIVKLCDRVCFIKDGRLIEEFNLENKDVQNIQEIDNKFKTIYSKGSIL
ncbi:ABC transporter ATP-binding protein [Williamsoniiplasma lucivorax]|uniref:ABC transporter ATP-binding protein n=1 Tax=Williamsoniiplasma lucivorax TaxID=209274 RepID=A0A2S5RF14_9MOLU|nr:ATP-binding cassette domain-containing protein [Williamsoniiplasma lucivorax]PPE05904.1 ABC transporter ATP-binding protein [Williamsoniiplasma lucivorax]